ncbi:MAG: hypothetical protein ABJB69_04155 [Spartobacteria bacterium]
MLDTNTNAPAPFKDFDPDQLTRLLELELIQKRAEWKQAGARHRSVRVSTFVFLFLLIIGSVVAFCMMSAKLSEQRSRLDRTGSEFARRVIVDLS